MSLRETVSNSITFTVINEYCKIVKVLPLRLNQCFGPFPMFPVEGFSHTGLYRHLSNHVFPGP